MLLKGIRRVMLPTSTAIIQFVTAREAEGLTPKTLQIYQERLSPFCKFIGDKRLAGVGPADVDGFMVMLRRRKTKYVNNRCRPTERGPLSEATLEGYKESIKVFFQLVRGAWSDRQLARRPSQTPPLFPLRPNQGDGTRYAHANVEICQAGRDG